MALPATATFSKMLYVMTVDLMSLKAPPMYFPFIFTSVSLVVKNSPSIFKRPINYLSCWKRGVINTYLQGQIGQDSAKFEAGKLLSAGWSILDILAAVNTKCTPHRVKTNDFLKELWMIYRHWWTTWTWMNISKFPNADPESVHMVHHGPNFSYFWLLLILPFNPITLTPYFLLR